VYEDFVLSLVYSGTALLVTHVTSPGLVTTRETDPTAGAFVVFARLLLTERIRCLFVLLYQ
jgi:hypothetical protein